MLYQELDYLKKYEFEHKECQAKLNKQRNQEIMCDDYNYKLLIQINKNT